jgi:hypothetical protein
MTLIWRRSRTFNKKCVFMNNLWWIDHPQREGTMNGPRVAPYRQGTLVILAKAMSMEYSSHPRQPMQPTVGKSHENIDTDAVDDGSMTMMIRLRYRYSPSHRDSCRRILLLKPALPTARTRRSHISWLTGYAMIVLSRSVPQQMHPRHHRRRQGPSTTIKMDHLTPCFMTKYRQLVLPDYCRHHSAEAAAVYADWRKRLMHPHFWLSSFFSHQNGPAKGRIRSGPTAQDLIGNESACKRDHGLCAFAGKGCCGG